MVLGKRQFSMPTLSLLHISDLHITEYSKTTHMSGYDRKVAIAIAEFAVARRDEFDRVLITGDLARTGTVPELTAAHDFLFAPASPGLDPFLTKGMRPTLGSLNRELWLMPGNHDRYRNWMGYPGGDDFDTVFGAHWDAGLRGMRSFRQQLDDDYSVAIIAADCCLETEADTDPPRSRSARFGQGSASGVAAGLEQLTHLERSLDHTKCAVIWAVHFPPTERGTIDHSLWLVNSEEVSQSAERVDVKLILAGHLHEQGVFQMKLPSGSSSSPAWCAGSPCAIWYPQWTGASVTHMAHIIDIRVGVNGPGRVDVTRRNFQYYPSAGFVEVAAFANGQRTPGVTWTI
jgi:3',5'-cyclic AMP phosphodiesterase CpdA